MKLCLKILAIVAIAATTYSLVSCATPSGFSYQNVSITLTAGCTNCPDGIDWNPLYPMPAATTNLNNSANGGGTGHTGTIPQGAVLIMVGNGGEGSTIFFDATVNNAPANVTWTLGPQPDLGSVNSPSSGTSAPGGTSGAGNIGYFSEPAGTVSTATGPEVYYYNNTVPGYGGVQLEEGNAMMTSYGLPGVSPNGMVEVTASVPSDPSNPSAVASTSVLIQFWNAPIVYMTPATPGTPGGLTNPVVTVAHNGGTFQFTGGAYGAAPCFNSAACGTSPIWTTDNTVVWKVGTSSTNAVVCTTPGSACPNGTISATGLYTAPATIPSGTTVVVCASHSVATVTKYAYVGIN